MKYITTQDEDGNEVVFTFPRGVAHDTMAEAVEALEGRTPDGESDWVFRQPVAAGFVRADGSCHGLSETLGLESRPTDTQLLAKQFGAPAPSTNEDSMKYIVTITDDGKEEIFTFDREIHHDAMAEVLGRIRNQTHGNWHRVRRTPVSAGFVRADNSCYGKSESLGLDSRPERDTQLLAEQLMKAY